MLCRTCLTRQNSQLAEYRLTVNIQLDAVGVMDTVRVVLKPSSFKLCLGPSDPRVSNIPGT